MTVETGFRSTRPHEGIGYDGNMLGRLPIVWALAGVLVAQVHESPAASSSTILAKVADIHGAAGVFAVAGYRIGERALAILEEPRGSFALDVTHKTPLEVQWSCVADGVQASTGVSAGKLNLHIVPVPKSDFETVIHDKHSGKEIVFRLQPSFLAKYLDTPRERQPQAANEVLALADDQIFTFRITESRAR